MTIYQKNQTTHQGSDLVLLGGGCETKIEQLLRPFLLQN
jgi:hypothetical protein